MGIQSLQNFLESQNNNSCQQVVDLVQIAAETTRFAEGFSFDFQLRASDHRCISSPGGIWLYSISLLCGYTITFINDIIRSEIMV